MCCRLDFELVFVLKFDLVLELCFEPAFELEFAFDLAFAFNLVFALASLPPSPLFLHLHLIQAHASTLFHPARSNRL